MKYKLVAIDCDNTLLDSEGYIPEENEEIIRILKQKGIQFILATGRNDILVSDYIKELGINAPVIGCNGASIRNLLTNELYLFNPIDSNAAKEVFKFLDKRGIECQAFTMEKGFSNFKEENSSVKHVFGTYTKALIEDMEHVFVEDIASISETEKIVKIVFVNEDPEFIIKTQKEMEKISGIMTCRSAKNCLDICAEGVSKGSALKKYSQENGFKREEIIAFGDSENDYSMLKYAGYSVAMENGEESIKDIADYITFSNNEAGVGKALKKIFKELL